MSLPAPAPVYYTRRLRTYVAELWERREFIWFLAIGNFKARNASTAFGLFWWVLNPLLLSLVYYLVFGLIFTTDRDILYLMSGMFVFHFTAQAMTGGAQAVLGNTKLLANLRFPRIILPIANLLESVMGFLVSLGLLLVLSLLVAGHLPNWSFLLLLVAIPLQFLFNLGLGCLAARVAVPFRDVNNLIPYLNRIWLYLSPIIWPLSALESARMEGLAPYATYNPMFSIISVYRTALLDYPFDPAAFIAFAAWAVVVGIIGIAVFIKYEGNIVRYL